MTAKKTVHINPIVILAILVTLLLVFVLQQMQNSQIGWLKVTIENQTTKIRQLQEQLKAKRQIEDKSGNKAIVQGFFDEWKKVVGRDAPYREVAVSGRVVRIYFANEYEATAFIKYTPEVLANFALEYFLDATKCDTVTVEYYTPLKRKIFEITKTDTGKETKWYDEKNSWVRNK